MYSLYKQRLLPEVTVTIIDVTMAVKIVMAVLLLLFSLVTGKTITTSLLYSIFRPGCPYRYDTAVYKVFKGLKLN